MPLDLTCDNTQRIVITANPDGDFSGEQLVAVVVSGDGTVSTTAKDGTPYPANQVALLSGDAAADTVFTLEGEPGDELPDTVTLHVTQKKPTTLNLSGGVPEPK